ncbi:hypothetical protein BB558_004892 [Smittium angustum]|uniref:Sel1 repeat family protein n=1 Tax=Smittium angustum TaxID=133377 RepID=A0A2U1J1Z2_SMIAN|nr:hypothetical protein BB558_004892 [Smittium angustum]
MSEINKEFVPLLFEKNFGNLDNGKIFSYLVYILDREDKYSLIDPQSFFTKKNKYKISEIDSVVVEKKAVQLLAKLGDNKFLPALLFNAKAIEYGNYGYTKNKLLALKYYILASDLGSLPATRHAAKLFDDFGYQDKSFMMYNQAALLGDPESNFRLGIAYMNGELGLNPQIYTAMEHLVQASLSKQFPEASYILGLLYLNMWSKKTIYMFVPYRPDKGLEYINKARSYGYEPAEIFYKELENSEFFSL